MTSSDLWDEEDARRYDEASAAMFAPEVLDPAVEFLARLAGDGPALELAIGTGRVAVPLAARGVPVQGIELSEPMVAQLRQKVDERSLPVVVGDMATTRVPGEFSLVYLVYNTISNLTTQEAQVACFRNAAAHLSPGGRFLIEVGVPGLRTLPPGTTHQVFHASDDYWGVDEYDVLNQGLISHHIDNDGGRYRRTSMPFRYAWPAEFDLMAQLAGMTLRDRWSGWRREPFTADSTRHVSVWQKPA